MHIYGLILQQITVPVPILNIDESLKSEFYAKNMFLVISY